MANFQSSKRELGEEHTLPDDLPVEEGTPDPGRGEVDADKAAFMRQMSANLKRAGYDPANY